MYKVVWVARFNPQLTVAEGRRRWDESHRDFVHRPDMVGYVRNFAESPLGPCGVQEVALAMDGYSCCWCVDRAAFDRFNAHTLMKMSPEASTGTFDMEHMVMTSAVLQERPLLDGATGPLKATWIMRFNDAVRADGTRIREQFARFESEHRRLLQQGIPGVQRCLQNHVEARLAIMPGDAGEGRPEFDEIEEFWFADRAAFDRAMQSPEWAAMNRCTQSLFDPEWSYAGHSALIEEHIMKAPTVR